MGAFVSAGLSRRPGTRKPRARPTRRLSEALCAAGGFCADLFFSLGATANKRRKGAPAMKIISSGPPPISGGGLPLWLSVGHFVLRAPARLARTELPAFLARIAAQPRDGSDFARVARLSRRWLRLFPFRARDTCYLRSLVLFRFIDAQGGDLCVHFGVDQPPAGEERLHGHAWISLNGEVLNGPATLAEGSLREIYRFSTVSGGSSTSGAMSAAAMIHRGGVSPATARSMPV